jgi:hypothetical protein
MAIAMLEAPCLGIQVENEIRFPEFQRPLDLFGMKAHRLNPLLLLVADHLKMKLNPPALEDMYSS